MIPVFQRLRDYYRGRSYRWETEPYRLNLCFIRGFRLDAWDDRSALMWVDDLGVEHCRLHTVTTDASAEEWTRPTHPDGCLYVLDGQYVGGLAPGLHRGRPALRQQVPYRCVRWTGQYVPSPDELEALGAYAFWGNQGTHWHNRASAHEPERPKRGDSQGCTVSLSSSDHDEAMALVDLQGERTGSYTVSPVYARAWEIGLGDSWTA